jgi:hypothetical protein
MFSRRKKLAALVAAGCVVVLGVPAVILSSDHQDTPEVELNSRCDINDVYAFPSPANADRIVLVMTTSSPIPGSNPGSVYFDTDKLYQIKIDNNVGSDNARDGVEDLVLQFTFSGTGADQTVTMRGPVAPGQTGPRNKLVGTTTMSGRIDTVLGSANDIQLFCGLKDDPFFIDLEQFFRNIPDRKPVTGGLSQLPDTPSADGFRDPGVEYLTGFNTLAIVVEMPESRLRSAPGKIGVWGTISR